VEKGERMPSQSPFRIEPSEQERAVLHKRARSHTGAYWEVVRARIVLLASEEVSNKKIASRLDTSPQVLWKWCQALWPLRSEKRNRTLRPPCRAGDERG